MLYSITKKQALAAKQQADLADKILSEAETQKAIVDEKLAATTKAKAKLAAKAADGVVKAELMPILRKIYATNLLFSVSFSSF